MGSPIQPGLEGLAGHGHHGDESGRLGALAAGPAPATGGAGLRGNAWGDFDLLPCLDGKTRRVESQPQSMADGVSALLDALRDAGLSEDQTSAAIETFPLTKNSVGRVMLLRGYGNAIAPELAAGFVKSSEEAFLVTAQLEAGQL